MQKYDFLIVGAGLCGCVLADQLTKAGASVLVVEKKRKIGGMCSTKDVGGIIVHEYGAHIFRTDEKPIWDYMNSFEEFNRFTNSPIARFGDELFNLPINMNTLHQLYGCVTPDEARAYLKADTVPCDDPVTLKEYVLSVAGKRVYEKLIKGYTEKQWGKPCEELPKEIMKRIPIRFTFDNNYYDSKYQGCPPHGYTPIFEQMLSKADLWLSTDFVDARGILHKVAKKIIYTGPLDALFGFSEGKLEYRSLRFHHDFYNVNNHQGVAVVNWTDLRTPYTRSIEHKHFNFGDDLEYTIVTKEYPVNDPLPDDEPFYSVNDERNNALHEQYMRKASERGYIVAGRLGEFRYYDMQDTIKSAMNIASALIN